MAKRTFNGSFTNCTASAIGSAAATGQFMCIKGGSGTQFIDILEVKISGSGTASAVLGTVLARVSTIETTLTTPLVSPFADGPMNPATAALAAPASTFSAAATGPTPSSAQSDTKFDLTTNAFGGIVRENFAPTQQFSQVGNTATLGETVLFNCSTYNGTTGSFNAAIIYEPA